MANLAEKIILSASQKRSLSEADFNIIKRKLSKAGRTKNLPGKTLLLKAYHKLRKQQRIAANATLEQLLIKRAVRTLSGVTIITSLTKPYPCPGECVYCPFDEKMPKSYLPTEPAAARALALKFNPYEQMARRIEALEKNGHPTEKIELIIKGGTWNAYPLPYQFWFILRSFEAANGTGHKIPPSQGGSRGVLASRAQSANLANTPLRRPPARGEFAIDEHSTVAELKIELLKQQKINEHAKHRIIGLTLETRPDCISEKTLWEMREQGATRVELGVQTTQEAVLKKIKRGHDAAESIRAIRALKNFGYKTDIHLMPQLPGATIESDNEMLKEIFDNPDYRPDMIKIYPCTVVKNSELYGWFKNGTYHAYPTKKLVEVIKKFKVRVPYYARISRLIRDIPGQHIEEGNKMTNLRQVIQAQMDSEDLRCRCLRCREVGHARTTDYGLRTTAKLFIDRYKASGGTEYFLSWEDAKRRVVFAFCRLRLLRHYEERGTSDVVIPPSRRHYEEELARRRSNPFVQRSSLTNGIATLPASRRVARNDAPYPAYIRELHTYGQSLAIGKRNKKESQHKGLGKKLIEAAEKICREKKIPALAVIAGAGVRGYYRKLGYRLENTYLVKKLV